MPSTTTPNHLAPGLQHAEILQNHEIIDVPAAIPRALALPRLPQGYGFIGGAARAVAMETFFGEQAQIRDIDIIGFDEFDPDPALAEELSEKYMPDDAAFGHGVHNESLSDYFMTRDFTINEVAVANGRVLATQAAYDDLKTKTIRLSDDWYGEPKLAVKSLLMQAAFKVQFGHSTLVVEGLDFEEVEDFHIALGLNKAFQYGPKVTAEFMRRLDQMDLVAGELKNDPVRLGRNLLEYTGFQFRGSEAADQIHNPQPEPSEEELLYQRAIDLSERFAGKGRQYIDGQD
ncbi:MAG TPA: hypothetical protein VK978_01695 [Candidatus Saccharimonadales bacterium]|nr:hypothetical protein [Candidatus Saccharimonadales bacterium]